MIEVQHIPNKGRGIIATDNIPEGTLLEVAPVASFPLEQVPNMNQTELFKYYFVRRLEYGKGNNVKGYLVFGLASLCNHKDKPNARVEWSEDEIGLWSRLIAEEYIKAGQEVTLFYTNIDEYADANNFV